MGSSGRERRSREPPDSSHRIGRNPLPRFAAGTRERARLRFPSDPGFCYLDVGNDGCFDAGTDTGPIDASLQAGRFPDPSPPGEDLPTDPGSIVCPPSVTTLALPFGEKTDWRTAAGSDILIFGARMLYRSLAGDGQSDDQIEMRSGRSLYLGKELMVASRHADPSIAVLLQAEDDVTIDGGVRVIKSCNNPGDCHPVRVVSVGGDVELGAKTKYFGSEVDISAAGSVTLEPKVQVKTYTFAGASIDAGGVLEMTQPKYQTSRLRFWTQGIVVHGTGAFQASESTLDWDAGFAAVIADALKLDVEADLSIRGDSIQVGGPAKSKMRTRRPFSEIDLTAPGAISLSNADLTSFDILLDTAGTTLTLAESRAKALQAGSTTTVQTGAGSTCDFTGTQFLGTTLGHDCGTVIGP